MIQFRASGLSNCLREIVAKILRPELTAVPEAKRPFLDLGHNFQDYVESFLLNQGIPLKPWMREAEGYEQYPGGWEITGHVDGAIDDYLLEVKAIKDRSYRKLITTENFLEQYPYYEPQAQAYCAFSWLRSPETNEQNEGNHAGSVFVFQNRDTGEMLGGFDGISHEAYTYRPDMFIEADPDEWAKQVERLNQAVEWLDKGEIPEDCDAAGYCYFCKTQGKRRKKRYVGPRLHLEREDYDDDYLDAYNIMGQASDDLYTTVKGFLKETDDQYGNDWSSVTVEDHTLKRVYLERTIDLLEKICG